LPQAIAVDSSATLYFNDPNGDVIYKFVQSGANFGTTSVGSKSSTLSLVFVFDSAGTIGAPSVVTQGTPNLDFTDAGTGTCTSNGTSHSYSQNDSCTVDVSFSPRAPGTRYGAVLLKNNAGNTIATGYVQGSGSGPQVGFSSGAMSTLSFNHVTDPGPMAIDAAGNIYIVSCPKAYDASCGIYKETWNGNGYTQTTVVDSSGVGYFPYGYPGGFAVDGAGNIFFTDPEDSEVVKASPSGSGYTITVPSPGKGTVWGLALDGSGNVYIGSFALGVIKETLSGSSYIQSTIARTTYAFGLAVDGVGNVYVADTSSPLLKETPSNGGYSQSSITSSPNSYSQVSVDAVGNVYASVAFGHEVVKETLSAGSYVESSIATIGQNTFGPSGIAVDGAGNIYIGSRDGDYPGSGTVNKIDVASPPSLTFARTAIGATSTDSPKTVTLQNIGNVELTFPVLSGGDNPSVASSFAVDGSGTTACPIVSSSATSPGTLAPGASCSMPISFTPTVAGDISGALTFTDNNLNASAPGYAVQTIQLGGTGAQATPTIVWPTPAAITYGTALASGQLNATASVPGTFSYRPAAGTVPTVGSNTLSVTFTPTDSTN
jgi:hypothetical protein